MGADSLHLIRSINLFDCISSLYRTADISEVEAREALLEYVNSQCCYGKGAAENMDIVKITSWNALHVSWLRDFEKQICHIEMHFEGPGSKTRITIYVLGSKLDLSKLSWITHPMKLFDFIIWFKCDCS